MRFGRDQVLEILRAATAPMTTVAIAEACRLAVGARGGRLAESPEVRSALDKLAGEGLVVTATHHEPGDYGFLVPAGQRTDRYWATPELAVKVAAEAETRRLRRDAADHATVRFKLAWQQAGGPPFNASNAWPYTFLRDDRKFQGQNVVELSVTDEQLAWLVEKLQR